MLAVDYGFQGCRYRFTEGEDHLIGSIVLTWNLFNGGQDRARRAAAAADVARPGSSVGRRAEVALEIRTSCGPRKSGARQCARRPIGWRARSGLVIELVDRRYRLGAAPAGGADRRPHQSHRRPSNQILTTPTITRRCVRWTALPHSCPANLRRSRTMTVRFARLSLALGLSAEADLLPPARPRRHGAGR